MATILERAFRAIEVDPRRRSLVELRLDLKSRDRDRHVTDSDSTCRWQATIVIGEFIPTQRDEVWAVALKLAKSPMVDVRAASSTVLLEHLLEYHPARMIPRFRAELANGDQRFRDVVRTCSNFGNSRTRDRIQRLLDEANAV